LKIGLPDLLCSMIGYSCDDSNKHKLTGIGLPKLLISFLQFDIKFFSESMSLKVMLKFLYLYRSLGMDFIAAKEYLYTLSPNLFIIKASPLCDGSLTNGRHLIKLTFIHSRTRCHVLNLLKTLKLLL
jgi:hypothetical protein